MKMKKLQKLLLLSLFLLGIINTEAQNPLSDPSNTGSWILNPDVSDEFNGTTLDKTKWWILGENNDYRSKWKGRAPGQFAPHNVKVENGDLTITSQWEDTVANGGYVFANESHDGTPYGGAGRSMPISQACIMSEKFFKYGYMEVRCKSADAPVTNAFWTTGYHSEIDMTENYGKRPIGNPQGRPVSLERKYRTNLISHDPDRTGATSYKTEYDIGPVTSNQRTASDYFVYGFEWDKNFVKIYFEGNLIETKTKSQIENDENLDWVFDFPQELWIDSEVFSWYGLPAQQDMTNPAEFKIDYVRIWQKELLSGTDLDPLSFEGPFYHNGRSGNWFGSGQFLWRMEDEKPNTGDFSVRYQQTTAITSNQTFFAPNGSLDIPSGNNAINMNIWIDPSTNINELTVILERPFKVINIDLTGITPGQKGTWVPISTSFSRSSASDTNISNGDRLRLQVRPEDVQGSNVKFYIDDITFDRNNALSIDESKAYNFNLFPNPANETITINSEDNSAIKVVSSLGVVVKSIPNASKSQVISVNDLAAGIYFVSVNSNSKKAIKKLIIK